MKVKLLLMITALVFVATAGFSLIVQSDRICEAKAAEKLTWQDYEITNQFQQWQGQGTSKNPYIISGAIDLARLAYMVNGGDFDIANSSSGNQFVDTYFKLTNHIDLSSRAWVAIGGSNRHFRGNFNGDGYWIKLPDTIMAEVTSFNRHFGLFGSITDATIQNLVIHGDVKTLSSTVSWSPTSTLRVGMLAGQSGNSRIKNVLNHSNFTSAEENGSLIVGGLIGEASGAGSNARKVNLANYGDITLGETLIVGGLIGRGIDVLIANSYNKGDIEISNTNMNFSEGGIGGIIGAHRMSLQGIGYENVVNFGKIQEFPVRFGQIHGARELTGLFKAVNVFGLEDTLLFHLSGLDQAVTNLFGTVNQDLTINWLSDEYGYNNMLDQLNSATGPGFMPWIFQEETLGQNFVWKRSYPNGENGNNGNGENGENGNGNGYKKNPNGTKAPPWWAILLICVGGVLLIGVTGVGVWMFIRKKKEPVA